MAVVELCLFFKIVFFFNLKIIVSQYAITENYARKIPTILTNSLQKTHVKTHVLEGDSNCH